VITLILAYTTSTDDLLFSWRRLLSLSGRSRITRTITNGKVVDCLIIIVSFGSKEAF
jgi:hypothetical protein